MKVRYACFGADLAILSTVVRHWFAARISISLSSYHTFRDRAYTVWMVIIATCISHCQSWSIESLSLNSRWSILQRLQ